MTNSSFEGLRDVLRALIGENGCPWDKEQTPLSLCDYVIEEAFELVEAIRSNNPSEACEELGDVMFLLFFLAERYNQAGEFDMDKALDGIRAKMIRRHPHVFADTSITCQDDILNNWERIKRDEKKQAPEDKPAGVFDSLPKGLPPLLRAYRINSKAARAGFTWPTDEDVEKQLASEWKELQEARGEGSQERIEEEFGDYLFTLAEYGRRMGIKSNAALDFANHKFLRRFQAMEKLALENGVQNIAELSFEEQDALWNKVKTAE
ncbi:MAG: nucleoside triphosphate pyrophosphohydrolase [Desulfovibrio sp.]|uniref:nucleoside triphosphate pyrophosphohydrolase n=1 Tax=Desulfovibrio sp. 7SRBS1 TaxID=3378064 RepID=UPI003B415CBF